MKLHKFYQRLANTILSRREESVDGCKNLNEYYQEIHDIADRMRNDRLLINKLLKEVEVYFKP